jgi:hypothetical protein
MGRGREGGEWGETYRLGKDSHSVISSSSFFRLMVHSPDDMENASGNDDCGVKGCEGRKNARLGFGMVVVHLLSMSAEIPDADRVS